MGYNFHITRAADWTASHESPITFDEWTAAVTDNENLHPDLVNSACDAFLTVAGEPDGWPIWWDDGRIYVKNPHRAVVAAMIPLAESLAARVVGDDDEVYRTADGVPTAAELYGPRRWWWPF